MIKKIADRFFRWFCHPDYYPDIRGDLEEIYQHQLLQHARWKADLQYTLEIALLLRISLLRPIKVFTLMQGFMIRNHTKMTLRKIWKEKFYSSIKIGGFALGVAACLLLIVFLRHELSYDRHYQQTDDIYRLQMTWLNYDNARGVEFPAPVVDVLRSEFPEIETAGRISMPVFLRGTRNLIRPANQQQNYYEEGVYFVEQEVLDILEIPMIYGSREHALNEPNSIVISKTAADKYFPGIDPVGEQMILNDRDTSALTIGGVMEDFPPTSHLSHLHFLFSFTDLEFWPGERTNWCCNNHRLYVRLKEGTDPEIVNTKLQSILTKYYLPRMQEEGITNPEEEIAAMVMGLQPVRDIHLDAEVFDNLPHGDRRLLWIFASAAFLILLLASVNFINLSTARFSNRAREVGVRRTVGAFKNQLIGQFLTESVIYSLISFVLGLLIAAILIPFFGQIAGKSLSIPWQEPIFLPTVLVASLATGILSGLYPAFFLSSFKPAAVMKGKISDGSRNPRLRNALVIFQFTTSIVLLIGTGIVFRQMQFILNKQIGFEKDQVMMLQGTNILGEKVNSLKEELLKVPGVENVSASDFLPIEGAKRNGTTFYIDGKEDNRVSGQWWIIDYDYLNTLGMQLEQGRDFSRDLASDSQTVIINREMAQQLALDQPLNQNIEFIGGSWRVIGVVEDFHFESIREEVRPLAFVLGNSTSVVSIKANAQDMPKVLSGVKGVWQTFAPHQPFRYQYMDERYALMYQDILRSGRIFSCFAVLAIIIACLGLFGLTAYIAEQRSKEIGIRKVLGASVGSIIRLVSTGFVKLVLISFLLAIPIGWYIMDDWLADFVYGTSINVWVFVISGVLALLIAVVTMSYHSLQSARANPVESIRRDN